jgi:hypothetical protein
MTTEIAKFRCPFCGHMLGEEEAKNAQQKKQKEIDEIVEQKLQQQIKQVQIDHAKEIQKINELHKLNRETEINVRVDKKLSEEKMLMRLEHSKELEEKDRQIETARLENSEYINEKISDAISNNEIKHRQREAERELHHGRIEADNKKLMDQVEKLQKTLDNIPQELRGTASEFVLSEELRKEFPLDEVRTKKVGVAMADVIQTIVTNSGEKLLIPIVYDRKTGDSVTKLDIAKAKSYKTIHNTEYSIIVTDKGIKDNRLSEEREGVLIVHPRIVVDIAKRTRSFVIEISKLTQCNKGRQTKQARLYDYFTSTEYYRDFEETNETKKKIDELQRKEEDYHKTMWNRRKEYVEKWFEINYKNERIVSDITQEDLIPDPEEKKERKEDEFDSSS